MNELDKIIQHIEEDIKINIICGWLIGSKNISLCRELSGRCRIQSSENCIYIKDKESAENLIKALQKAIELNWWA